MTDSKYDAAYVLVNELLEEHGISRPTLNKYLAAANVEVFLDRRDPRRHVVRRVDLSRVKWPKKKLRIAPAPEPEADPTQVGSEDLKAQRVSLVA